MDTHARKADVAAPRPPKQEPPPLYAPRARVYPRAVAGKWRRIKWATLVVLLAESAGLSVDDTLRTVGIHGWRHLEQRQPELVAGVDDLGTLLHSLNHVVHTEVRKLYPDSLVPQFDIADEGPGRWLVTYESERRMCRLAEGLLIGFSDSRGISTAITHVSCINYGDAACVLDVVVT